MMTIIQNRVKNKINYQTNFTDFPIIVEYCRQIKKYGKVKSGDVNKVCGEKRAEISNWQASKSDSHAKITLLQYGLIELVDYDYYSLSKIGEEFVNLFDDENQVIADREIFLNVMLKMMCAWYQSGNGFDIHPGRLLLRLLVDEDIHGYISDQDFACICNDVTNTNDNQYEDIKEKLINFRNVKKYFTRNELKKTYTLLTGYVKWGIFDQIKDDNSNMVIVKLKDDFREKVLNYFKNDYKSDKLISEQDFTKLVNDLNMELENLEKLAEKYGEEGNRFINVKVRLAEVQNAFRDRLIDEFGQKCLMCNITNKELLIASHIKDAAKSNIYSKADKDNGLLLCAGHDKLFDKFLISFSFLDGKIMISSSLTEEEKKLLHLDDNYVLPHEVLNEKRREYLVWHNDEFYKKNN